MDLKKRVENGENVPLSFYFDLSGSMEDYIRILSTMALRILKKDVKVIIGFNQNAYVQINKIPQNCTPEQFKNIMSNLQYLVNWELSVDSIRSVPEMNIKSLELEELNGIEINRYLIKKRAEKVVIFSDFDPKNSVENLSQKCEVYWFCFRDIWRKGDLENFKGKFFKTLSEKDILEHLKHINSKVYERKQRESGELKESEEFRNFYRYNVNQNMMTDYSNLLGENDNERFEFEEDEYYL